MKTRKLLAFTSVLLAFVFTSGLALAQDAPDKEQRKGKNRFVRCLSILDLSEAQQSQIKGILEAAQPTIQAIREEIHANKEALREQLQSDSPDSCLLGDSLLQVKAGQDELMGEKEKIKASVEALLTPEQVAKLNGCLQAPRDGEGQGNGQGQGQGGGGPK